MIPGGIMDKQKQQELINRINALTGRAAMTEFFELIKGIGNDHFAMAAVHAGVENKLLTSYAEIENEQGIVIWIHHGGLVRVEAFPLSDGMFNLVVCRKFYDNDCNLVWHRFHPTSNMWLKPEQFDEWLANNMEFH